MTQESLTVMTTFEAANILSRCLLMLDANEASECAFDEELYNKAMELADIFVNGAWEG